MPNQAKTKDPQAELIEALIEFQRTCPSIAKDKEGYGYKYTPLEKFLSVVNPALNKVGLAQSQSYDFAIAPDGENSKTIIVTTLFHKSGASITSRLPVREPLGKNAKKDIMHEWGGITTYSRRYALKMILGLEPDMDMNLEDVIDRNESSHPAGKVFTAKKEIARSPQRGANAKRIANEMITGKAPTSTPPEQYLPLINLERELRDLAPNLRSTTLQRFKTKHFPKSDIVGNKGLFELIKTEQHINDVKAIIEDIKIDSP